MLASTRRSALLVTTMLLPDTRLSLPELIPLRSNRPDPSKVSAPAVAEPLSVIALDRVELKLLVVSPTVSVAPLKVMALLLPTLLSVVKLWLALKFRTEFDGVLFTSPSTRPAGSA